MKIRTLKILITILLVLVCIDLLLIYLDNSTFNALYASSTLILFGIAWDALGKLQSRNSDNS